MRKEAGMKRGFLFLIAGFMACMVLSFTVVNHVPEESEDRNESNAYF